MRNAIRLMPFPLAGLSMASVGMGFGAESFLPAAAIAAFTAAMMFCWTSVFHEAAHHTLWRSKTLNVWTGKLLGTFMFTPYNVYREAHVLHHAYLNSPRDLELWPYSDPNTSLGFRRMFVWIDLFFGVVTGPFIYGRTYFHHDSPISSPAIRKEIRNEYAAIAIVWISIWGYTTVAGIWPEHLRGVLLPMSIAAFFQTGRKFTEHLGMSSFDPLEGTRTVLPQKPLLRINSFLNFNIFVHGPHHRHPRLAHTSLESKFREYQNKDLDVTYPAYDRYWKATLAMLPAMISNPGCGLNIVNPTLKSNNSHPKKVART